MRDWPFVGRDAELEAVRAAYADGDVAAVVVIGEIGTGKTRLAREVLRSFVADGRPTVWVRGTQSLRSIPFGAVAHLLPTDWRAGGDRLAVLTAIAARVRAMGTPDRALLVFDDAQLLDLGSAALLSHLAAQRLALLLITVRGGAKPPDPIIALCKDGLADRLDLTTLPAPAIDALVDHTLGADVEGMTRRRMHRAVAGNPLALRELLAHGTATGALRQTYGVWRLATQWSLTPDLPALVASRLRPPTTNVRRVLDVLACGEPLPLAWVEALVGPQAVDAAEVDGHVVVEPDGVRTQTRLAHPLYGEVLRAAMPVSRARRIRRELSRAALAGPLRRRGDALRVSLWQVDGGAVDRPDVVRIGARDAFSWSDLELAERLARAARDADPGPESDHLLAQILEYRGRSTDAARLLAVDLPIGPGQLGWQITRADTLYWGAGDVAAAERALDLATAEPDGAGMAEGSRTWIQLFDGRCRDALDLAGALVATEGTRPQAAVWAAAAGTAAAGFLGRPDDAGELYAFGRNIAQANEDWFPLGVDQVDFAWGLAHMATGDATRAETIATAGYRRAVELHAPLMAGAWAGLRGLVALAAGRPVEADRALREAVATLSDNDTLRLVRLFLGGLAMASALRGDGPAANDWLHQADRRATAANRLFAPWLHLARAWTAAADGTTGKAAAIAAEAAELARTIGLPTVEEQARYDVMRLNGRGERVRLARLHATIRLPWTDALVTAATGLDRMDGGRLRLAADAFARLGQRLLAAECALEASRAFRLAGHRGRPAAALEQAIGLRAGCEGATTPLLATEGQVGVLTPREREVARLAVRYTSREIAGRLGLSQTTVNNNLARVYAKLGIAGRGELGPLFDPGPLD